MKKAISILTFFTILLFVASAIAHDKVVVVPLNSNSASGVDITCGDKVNSYFSTDSYCNNKGPGKSSFSDCNLSKTEYEGKCCVDCTNFSTVNSGDSSYYICDEQVAISCGDKLQTFNSTDSYCNNQGPGNSSFGDCYLSQTQYETECVITCTSFLRIFFDNDSYYMCDHET
jgi:hypothetical protein